MSYHLEEKDGGWVVVGPNGPKSNHPLSRDRAVRQMRALYANEPGIAHAQKGGVVPMKNRQTRSKLNPNKPSHRKLIQQQEAAAAAAPGAPGVGGMPPVMALQNQQPGTPGMVNGGYFIAKATKGAHGQFRKKAEAAGMSTAEYAKEKEHAPGKLGQQARLAEALMGLHHGKKK